MYRNVTKDEIAQLEYQGCQAESWDKVFVAEGFNPSRVRNTRLSGEIKLGLFTGRVCLEGGIELATGIYSAVLHNVTVGNNVLISNVANYIANYTICDDAILYQVRLLVVDGKTTYGNGIPVSVINESGGREVRMYNTLSSHTAYLLALYRYRTTLIDRLETMITQYASSVASTRGMIGEKTRIIDCGPIRNVTIGPSAVLEGVGSLREGTINSSHEDPVEIGLNVVAEHFIISEGAKISDNSIIDRCFIGQATELSKQYSAENSLFFANCGGYHGEACSIFAGPYTVTHHKSTLLIAGLFSFLNAGSGSNQSNHMYKLGPNHQGIVERGSKTASDSYMLWPMHVGAFSLVMGRHYSNSDTSEFPFSYLIEHDDETLLIPAVNLRSVGTVRDSRKWVKRDGRKTKNILDHIIFHLLTPYTVQRIMKGQKRLEQIKRQAGHSSQTYYYNGVRIARSSLENGINLYELAIRRYLGNIVMNHLRAAELSSVEDVFTALRPKTEIGSGEWLDISGLIVPKEEIDRLIADIEDGQLQQIEMIENRFKEAYTEFPAFELTWVMQQICLKKQKSFSELTLQDIKSIISHWIAAVIELDNLRCKDAEKEFAQSAKIGYALHGTEKQRDEEYSAIHGSVESNAFIMDLKDRLEAKIRSSEAILAILSGFEE